MQLRQRRLQGLFDVMAAYLPDERGALFKIYDKTSFGESGSPPRWDQIIYSHTKKANTIRGLYVQPAPFTEGKMVSCLRGETWWVVVDLRAASQTYGAWEGVHMTPGSAILIERGFAHGCLSLTDDVDLMLLADNIHAHAEGIGIRWNDPDLAIAWPLQGQAPIISEAHAAYRSFANFKEKHSGIAQPA